MRALALLALLAAVPLATSATSSSAPTFVAQSTAGAENAGTITATVAKNAVAKSYSKLEVTTVDGTAKAGVDYASVRVTVTVANKQLLVSVPVKILSRSGYQGTRSFTVHVKAVRNAVVLLADATVTIIETEQPPPPPPPPPPATQTCPDGSTIPATSSCPPPPPPPVSNSTGWAPTGGPPQIGGYAFVKGSNPAQQCCNGLIVRITGRWYDEGGHALDVWSTVYAADPSGNFPASNPYWATHEGGLGTENIIPVAPAT